MEVLMNMGLFKRAIASISRRMSKSVMLFLLIFILGTLMVGGITVQRAIGRTEENLRNQIPPLVSIEFDWSEWMNNYNHLVASEGYQEWQVTRDFIHQVGALPYVDHFNYSIGMMLMSFDFEGYDPGITGNVGETGMEGMPHLVNMTAVSEPDIIYIDGREGFELVAGRMFERSEMTTHSDTIPIVMSRPLAEANGLSLDSVFILHNMVTDHFNHHGPEVWLEENLVANIPYEFQVVGLFDLVDRRTDLMASNDEDWNEWNRQWGRLNTVYIPSQFADDINREAFDLSMTHALEVGTDNPWFEPDGTFQPFIDAMFILENVTEIENFRLAVEPLMPAYYYVADLTGSFADMTASMETMLWIADIILATSIIATILILSLIITLFLRDRRYEMGIYLALGEKKLKVVSQILFEIVATAVLGLTLAVFIGNVVTSQVSRHLLLNNLVSQVEPEERNISFGVGGGPRIEDMGFMVQMSPDEMMEAFSVDLEGQTIAILYGIGVGTVIVGALAPVIYIVGLNPKKILMEAKS